MVEVVSLAAMTIVIPPGCSTGCMSLISAVRLLLSVQRISYLGSIANGHNGEDGEGIEPLYPPCSLEPMDAWVSLEGGTHVCFSGASPAWSRVPATLHDGTAISSHLGKKEAFMRPRGGAPEPCGWPAEDQRQGGEETE